MFRTPPSKEIQLLLAGLLIGLAAGFFLGTAKGGGAAEPDTAELEQRALAYVKENFLLPRGFTGRVVNTSPYGSSLYRLDVEILRAGEVLEVTPVYVTRDGEILVLQLVNMSQPLPREEPRRVEVSQDDDPAIGPEDAPVVIVEFSDYQCPYCRKFAMETLDRILEEYRGRVRFVYRDFPLESIHAYALKAAEAANCAGEQGRYFEYHDLLFERQEDWSSRGEAAFLEYAQQLGLDAESFSSCLSSGKYEEEVRKDLQDGMRAGVRGTPAFFINGIPLSGAQPFEAFKAIIDAELARKGVER
ncbi:MAG: thioredoxin domain-containing protein [Euryarchaeota archaeon]|nr:thioredoxin domain-containing protein [Euryarchaeota archaeon]